MSRLWWAPLVIAAVGAFEIAFGDDIEGLLWLILGQLMIMEERR